MAHLLRHRRPAGNQPTVTAQALVLNLSVSCPGFVFGFVAWCCGYWFWLIGCGGGCGLFVGDWFRGVVFVVFVVFGFVALGLVLVARPHSVFRRAFPLASYFLLLSSLRNFLFASRPVPSQPSIPLSKLQSPEPSAIPAV